MVQPSHCPPGMPVWWPVVPAARGPQCGSALVLARRALPDCVSAARRRSVGLFAATALLLGACTVECKPCLGAPAVQIVGVLPDQGRVLWVCVDVNWPPSRLSTPTASDTYPATRAIHRARDQLTMPPAVAETPSPKRRCTFAAILLTGAPDGYFVRLRSSRASGLGL